MLFVSAAGLPIKALAESGQEETAQDLACYDLRCEYRNNPVSIGTVVPRLSWKLRSRRRGVVQAAYRLQVSTKPELLSEDRADLWDSKRVAFPRSLNVEYAGKPLESRAVCFWRVKVWDGNGGESAWSAPAQWSVGLLQEADWSARWICLDQMQAERNATPVFRKSFELNEEVERATAYVCGLGQFDFFVNGQRQGDSVLDPGWTNYRKTCLYVTFDLTAAVRRGKNAVGVMLGNGMYNVKGGRYVKFTGSFGAPCAIVQLEIVYRSGAKQRIVSDDSWQVVQSPITFSCVYGGEDYDARREMAGWNTSEFDDSKLLFASVVNGPGGALTPTPTPPIRVHQTYQPIKISEPVPGTHVFDFGQNLSGWPAIKVKGPAGSSVRMIPGELLDERGFVSQKSAGGGPVYFTYVLKGAGIEEWRPQFSYFGFRYVQINGISLQEGAGDKPTLIAIESQFVHTALDNVGTFACSNDLFNQTHKIITAAILSNAQSVLTDCPHREKLGWLDPVQFMAPSIMYNYDVAAFYEKLLSDVAQAQVVNGLVPDIAPEYLVFWDGFRDSPEWGCTYPIVADQISAWYGSERVLRQHFDGMRRYVDYLLTKRQGGILRYGLGDWCDIGPNPPFSQDTPAGLTATALLFAAVQVIINTSRLLGQPETEAIYKKAVDEISTAFHQHFYDAAKNVYGNGSQTSLSLPLAVGLIPEHRRQTAVRHLVADVQQRGLTAGDVGHRFLLLTLAQAGQSSTVFELHSKTDTPGYGYQLQHGATTLIESWDARPETSQNHCMLGHIEEWFYQSLAGIRPQNLANGFRKVIIQPNVVGDARWCKASHRCPYGLIRVDWTRGEHQFDLNIEIPPNTSAVVYLPYKPGATITESGQSVQRVPEIVLKQRGPDQAIFEIGSGEYQFAVHQI
jgi:hypothetical protein